MLEGQPTVTVSDATGDEQRGLVSCCRGRPARKQFIFQSPALGRTQRLPPRSHSRDATKGRPDRRRGGRLPGAAARKHPLANCIVVRSLLAGAARVAQSRILGIFVDLGTDEGLAVGRLADWCMYVCVCVRVCVCVCVD